MYSLSPMMLKSLSEGEEAPAPVTVFPAAVQAQRSRMTNLRALWTALLMAAQPPPEMLVPSTRGMV